MIQRKVCMLGSFAVGKSSLARRFAEDTFSDTYRTTLGVKIDKKVVEAAGEPVTMIVWDVQGDDDELRVVPAYLRGMSGYLLVVDRSRPYTIATALDLVSHVDRLAGEVPFVLAMNKSDLRDEWQAEDSSLATLTSRAVASIETSAKLGIGVETCFEELAHSVLPSPAPKSTLCKA